MSHTTSFFSISLLILLLGCVGDKTTPDTEGTDPPVRDADGDGFSSAVDCDDASSAIYPGAEERCNGLDDDCDGESDEPGVTDGVEAYPDADDDGFGASAAVTVCETGSGYAKDSGDCDDGDAAINPDATELCDGQDNDCDGETDEPGTPDGTAYPVDADGDGYGHPVNTGVACAPGDGFATSADDCDDGDPGRHPGAEESCDGEDEDCDGEVDEDPTTGTTVYADTDGDRYGDPAGAKIVCSSATGFVSNDDDCDDRDADINPRASERCNGVDDDCDGATDEEGAVDGFSAYADSDGDGYGALKSTLVCALSSGYLDVSGDCDDSDAAINPDATEVCDRQDNDCDGDTDEPGTPDGTDYYVDADGDGYGDPDRTGIACGPGDGYSATGDDCDDDDATVHPGAPDPEDGVDNDCDGELDEGGDFDVTMVVAVGFDTDPDYRDCTDLWTMTGEVIDPCDGCEWAFEVSYTYDDSDTPGTCFSADVSAGFGNMGYYADYFYSGYGSMFLDYDGTGDWYPSYFVTTWDPKTGDLFAYYYPYGYYEYPVSYGKKTYYYTLYWGMSGTVVY